MAQHHDIEPPQEQFGPQLNQEQWAQENYDNSPHLVYKTGSFRSPNFLKLVVYYDYFVPIYVTEW